jgi:hypothetical protein
VTVKRKGRGREEEGKRKGRGREEDILHQHDLSHSNPKLLQHHNPNPNHIRAAKQAQSTTSDLLAIGHESECSARFKVPARESYVGSVDVYPQRQRATYTHNTILTHQLTYDIGHLVVIPINADHNDQIAHSAWSRPIVSECTRECMEGGL